MRALLPVLALIWAACSASDPPPNVGPDQPFRNVGADVEFVGAAACASCHEDQYAGFQDHGMANSFYELTEDVEVEDFSGVEVVDEKGGYVYRALRDGDAYYQVEELRDHAGTVVHRLRREMRFVMGSGTAARTYFDDSQGYLYQLPLTWYTQEGRWDFSPGYRLANKRFDRTVPERCMACHNDYTSAAPFSNGKFSEIPEGIGCERCHGPGSLHVSERLAVPEPLSDIDSTIVNPAHLSLDRRLDVCQQCHLHTTVSVLRENQEPFGFRPSHDLSAFIAMYASSEASTDDEISVISHADRMKQSACFIQTISGGGSFECTTCHDPHQGFRSSEASYFNDTCQTCHAPAELANLQEHPVDANCIDCHMPKVESVEAPHSSFTDHRVRVVSSREIATAAQQDVLAGRQFGGINEDGADQPGQVLEPYFGVDASAGNAYEGMSLIILGRQRGDQTLLRQGADMLDQLKGCETCLFAEAHFLRGLARLELGDPRAALDGLGQAIQTEGDNPDRLNGFAQAVEATGGDGATIREAYNRALQAQPSRADIWVNYGRYLESQGETGQAEQAYRRAVEEKPRLSAGSYNLGTILARLGRLDEAGRVLRRAVNLEPKDTRAWGNLGAVYAQSGIPDSARFAFQQAVTLAPSSPIAFGNLGAFLLNAGEYDEAIENLDQAIRLRPDFADALANRGAAHLSLGERASARLYARRALEVMPGHPVASQVLAATN